MYKAQAESGAGQPGDQIQILDNQNTNTDSKVMMFRMLILKK